MEVAIVYFLIYVVIAITTMMIIGSSSESSNEKIVVLGLIWPICIINLLVCAAFLAVYHTIKFLWNGVVEVYRDFIPQR